MSVDGSSGSYEDSDVTDSADPFLRHGEEELGRGAYPEEDRVDAYSSHGLVPEDISEEVSRVDAVREDALDLAESTLNGELRLELAADELTKLLTTNTWVIFARKALEVADAKYEKDQSDIRALSQRDAALQRYIGKLHEALGDRHDALREGLDRAQIIVESPDATSSAKDFITKGLLLIGVAVLASVSAGAIGALVVKEMVWKEVIKSAIGAFVTGMATLVAEQAWRKKKPDISS